MNAPPTPTPEPILSLPVGPAVLGLLLLIGGVAFLALRLTRRGGGAIRAVPGVDDVPWLGALVDGLPQAALIVDRNGRPVAWNTAAARFLTLTDGAAELPLSLAALVTRVFHAGISETTEVAAPDAPDRRLRVSVSPLGGTGERGALVLVQSLAEAAQSAESYRRLISAVAHELRTPLTAILGHADILGSCKPEKEEALWRRSRDFIASEANRLARLVEDLLTLSRLDLTPLQRRPVNLRAVAEEAISALFQAAEARGVRLALQSPPSMHRVLGDRDRLQQVFLNLIDNAVKYSSADGEAIVRLSPERNNIQVEVRDDGIGIAPEDLPHIFDPLYRSRDVRDTSGTGLGLTIVRTILEQHDVTIDVQSAPGSGTAFRFRLPYAHSSSSFPRVSHSGTSSK